jgi:hypothetical protein
MFFPAGSMEKSCSQWIELSAVEFTIPEGKSEELRFTVTIPESKTSGGYWSVIFFESIPEPTEETSGLSIQVAGRVGTIIYLTVGNDITRSGTISDFTIDRGEDGNLIARTMIENLGNVPIRVSGTIKVKGDTIDSLFGELKIQGSVVLPETNREFKTPLALYNLKNNTTYKAIVYVDFGGDEVIAGETVFNLLKSGKIIDFVIQDADNGIPSFTIRFRNDSSTGLLIKGQIKLSDTKGKEYCSMDLPGTVVAGGGKEQEIKAISNKLIPRGKYTAVVSLDYGGDSPLTTSKQFNVGKEDIVAIYQPKENGSSTITEPSIAQADTNKIKEEEPVKREITEQDKEKINKLYKDGVEHFTKGEYEKAIDKWSQILSIDPDYKKAKKSIEDAKARLAKIKG